MSFLIGLLTVVMVLNCLVLMLLVLIQLPKKEAGAGLAFGGGATDALFGAGTGNALTKITKWSATLFFALAIGLSWMNARVHRQNATLDLSKGAALTEPPVATATASKPAAIPATTGTNALLALPLTVSTNSLNSAVSNAPAGK
ncbi:MAG TPA: preprotein translocase subunit SecG [Dongiaceae bacterium]|jgi:preprotein translocase subunit SecG|nr:preprotein translocase subunit SecG [Dongiaceae bacterium]